ncbi:hypothetical protein ZHAS_00013334 [Anopheles sinensis]|uniref:Uncharacterized protein n=1 Tax=Anopheles sinensis TaxID=74873 RepID=A0A084W5B1_ANOSI|nr:hypothetical protein ZHAS_00013334 [Anopheles sinensis]
MASQHWRVCPWTAAWSNLVAVHTVGGGGRVVLLAALFGCMEFQPRSCVRAKQTIVAQ